MLWFQDYHNQETKSLIKRSSLMTKTRNQRTKQNAYGRNFEEKSARFY